MASQYSSCIGILIEFEAGKTQAGNPQMQALCLIHNLPVQKAIVNMSLLSDSPTTSSPQYHSLQVLFCHLMGRISKHTIRWFTKIRKGNVNSDLFCRALSFYFILMGHFRNSLSFHCLKTKNRWRLVIVMNTLNNKELIWLHSTVIS